MLERVREYNLLLIPQRGSLFPMKKNKIYTFLAVCTAAIFTLSVPAWASQVTITPLDKGTSISQSQVQETQPTKASGAQNTSGENTPSQKGDVSSITKPTIASQGAVLLNAADGSVLFSQNGETQYYPASITKLMTALLVAENCNLDDTVTFSSTATTNLESGAVSIGMTEGDTLSVRQCLYALLLKSANEVGNALAEHVAGSNAAFAEKMNAKAASLGCTNTHFANPHGLNDPNHYTTPHDMALIARAAFANDIVKTVASTRTYTLPATKKNPSGLTVTMGHKMLNPKDSRYYQGIIGGKTGYTSKAGNTLVTAAERNGVRLIAVVMKSQSTHYTDTKALLDYGFKLAEAGALTGQSTSQNNTQVSGPASGKNASDNSSSSSNQAQETQGTTVTPAGQETAASTPVHAVSSGNNTGGPGVTKERGWVKDDTGWYYVKNNGVKASNEWITDNGEEYWIQADHYMAKGWKEIDGNWYYLCSTGSMAKNVWKTGAEGNWYYLGPDGVMLTNTKTPDGYRVGADGVWIQ